MIQREVTIDMIAKADQLSEEMGNLNGSILNGRGNFIEMIGELIVVEYFNTQHLPTYDYDLLFRDYKWDVKTKACTSEPKLTYDASVSNWNTKQECDIYVFTRVEKDRYVRDYLTGRAWIMGWLPKQEYFDKATFCKKGEVDPNGNGWVYKDDCYNLAYSELNMNNKLI